MSRARSIPKHSPPSPDHPPHPELASVAKTLQEAAQALLNLTAASPPDEAPRDEPKEPARQAEYRSYRVPFHTLKEEQELLTEYDTDSMAHALREIYNEFFLMLELMKGYAESNDNKDYTYFLVAQQLFKPLDRLNQACSVLVEFELQATESVSEA
jgi:hypothetical protein